MNHQEVSGEAHEGGEADACDGSDRTGAGDGDGDGDGGGGDACDGEPRGDDGDGGENGDGDGNDWNKGDDGNGNGNFDDGSLGDEEMDECGGLPGGVDDDANDGRAGVDNTGNRPGGGRHADGGRAGDVGADADDGRAGGGRHADGGRVGGGSPGRRPGCGGNAGRRPGGGDDADGGRAGVNDTGHQPGGGRHAVGGRAGGVGADAAGGHADGGDGNADGGRAVGDGDGDGRRAVVDGDGDGRRADDGDGNADGGRAGGGSSARWPGGGGNAGRRPAGGGDADGGHVDGGDGNADGGRVGSGNAEHRPGGDSDSADDADDSEDGPWSSNTDDDSVDDGQGGEVDDLHGADLGGGDSAGGDEEMSELEGPTGVQGGVNCGGGKGSRRRRACWRLPDEDGRGRWVIAGPLNDHDKVNPLQFTVAIVVEGLPVFSCREAYVRSVPILVKKGMYSSFAGAHESVRHVSTYVPDGSATSEEPSWTIDSPGGVPARRVLDKARDFVRRSGGRVKSGSFKFVSFVPLSSHPWYAHETRLRRRREQRRGAVAYRSSLSRMTADDERRMLRAGNSATLFSIRQATTYNVRSPDEKERGLRPTKKRPWRGMGAPDVIPARNRLIGMKRRVFEQSSRVGHAMVTQGNGGEAVVWAYVRGSGLTGVRLYKSPDGAIKRLAAHSHKQRKSPIATGVSGGGASAVDASRRPEASGTGRAGDVTAAVGDHERRAHHCSGAGDKNVGAEGCGGGGATHVPDDTFAHDSALGDGDAGAAAGQAGARLTLDELRILRSSTLENLDGTHPEAILAVEFDIVAAVRAAVACRTRRCTVDDVARGQAAWSMGSDGGPMRRSAITLFSLVLSASWLYKGRTAMLPVMYVLAGEQHIHSCLGARLDALLAEAVRASYAVRVHTSSGTSSDDDGVAAAAADASGADADESQTFYDWTGPFATDLGSDKVVDIDEAISRAEQSGVITATPADDEENTPVSLQLPGCLVYDPESAVRSAKPWQSKEQKVANMLAGRLAVVNACVCGEAWGRDRGSLGQRLVALRQEDGELRGGTPAPVECGERVTGRAQQSAVAAPDNLQQRGTGRAASLGGAPVLLAREDARLWMMRHSGACVAADGDCDGTCLPAGGGAGEELLDDAAEGAVADAVELTSTDEEGDDQPAGTVPPSEEPLGMVPERSGADSSGALFLAADVLKHPTLRAYAPPLTLLKAVLEGDDERLKQIVDGDACRARIEEEDMLLRIFLVRMREKTFLDWAKSHGVHWQAMYDAVGRVLRRLHRARATLAGTTATTL